jgi:hypothetical protein
MAEHQIRFDDGVAYERMMGAWSKLAGGIFLDWIVVCTEKLNPRVVMVKSAQDGVRTYET